MLYPWIEEGGLLWMLPIVFLSFYAVGCCLERAWYWLVYGIRTINRDEILQKMFQMPAEMSQLAQLCSHSKDIVVQVLYEFLSQYQAVGLMIAERKARMTAETKVDESRHFLDILALIANISGTLGLMGTVVGIALIFKSLSREDAKGISLALATALYTTIAGIIVFLFSYLPMFFFQRFSDRLETVLDTNIQKMKDWLEFKEKSSLVFENNQASVANNPSQTVAGVLTETEKNGQVAPVAAKIPTAGGIDEDDEEEEKK